MPRDRADIAANAIMTAIRLQVRRGRTLNTLDISALRKEIADIIRDELHNQRGQDRDETNPD
jgi:hypothetical protein